MTTPAPPTTHDAPPHGTDAHDHEHPGRRQYYIIAVVLTILTAAEVAAYYIEVLAPVLVPILLILSVGKFVLVVQFYMHLKFDHRVFATVFLGPMLLATALIISLILLYHVLPAYKFLN